jgi:hypothetical protein
MQIARVQFHPAVFLSYKDWTGVLHKPPKYAILAAKGVITRIKESRDEDRITRPLYCSTLRIKLPGLTVVSAVHIGTTQRLLIDMACTRHAAQDALSRGWRKHRRTYLSCLLKFVYRQN